jgi:hypothetical protein
VSSKTVDMIAMHVIEVEGASDPRRPWTYGLRGLGQRRSRRPRR